MTLRALPAILLAAVAVVPAGAAHGGQAGPCLLVPSVNDRCESWVARFDDGTQGLDVAADVAAAPAGDRVYVTGSSYVAGQAHPMFDSTTLAYDAATGAELWRDRIDGVPDTWDFLHDVEVSPDGATVYVAGVGGLDFRGGGDFLVVAYDVATGSPRWQGRYDGGSIDEAFALAVAADGARVYATGVSLGEGTDRDYATAAFDAGTGAQVWASRYDGPASRVDQPVAIAVTRDGARVFVTGWSAGATGDDYATIAYEAGDADHLGEQRWLRRHDAAGREDRPAGLALSLDGSRVSVAGRSQRETGGAFDAATVTYEASSGEVAWEARFAPADGAEATAVAAGDGRLYVTGFTTSPVANQQDRDVVTHAYAASSGAEEWSSRPGPSAGLREAAIAIAVTPDGDDVLVMGPSTVVTATGRPGIVTVAHASASGTPRWVARYGNGSPAQFDSPTGMTVSPTGDRLFVTGASSQGPTENGIPRELDDYLTLAYDLTA